MKKRNGNIITEVRRLPAKDNVKDYAEDYMKLNGKKIDFIEIKEIERVKKRNGEQIAKVSFTYISETPQSRYDKVNTERLHIKLNKHTDADIIKKLNLVDNKQGYVKNLIRKDIDKDTKK
ncbi:MAG: hypothetical protein K6D02_01840 [Lachnospiraceae bacterium]|nr:hypothetical protein [Lachnospiraceae bacterium]